MTGRANAGKRLPSFRLALQEAMPPPERTIEAAQRRRKPAEARGAEARKGLLPHVGRVTQDENNGGKYPGNREVLDHLEFYSDRQGRVRT